MIEYKPGLPEGTFAIFQVKDGDDYRSLRFASLKQVEKDVTEFRDKIMAEAENLNGVSFYNRSEAIARLREDGFTVLPTEETNRITIQGESLRTADFYLAFGPRSCSVVAVRSKDVDTMVRFSTYDQVYTGQIPDEKLDQPYHFLDELFTQFNIEHPADYTGRSMSVSDVVVLSIRGIATSYYVEPAGFEVITGFEPPVNALKNAEMSLEDDYDMIDGIINNGEKKSVREEMNEYRNMTEAYVHPFPKNENKDHSDLEH